MQKLSVSTRTCVLWNLGKTGFSKTTCELVCAHNAVWLSAEGSVGRNSCDSAPWGESSSFPCKHNSFSCWQSHEPPQGAVLQDIDRKPRQPMACSPVLGAESRTKWMRVERENGLVCLLLTVAIQWSPAPLSISPPLLPLSASPTFLSFRSLAASFSLAPSHTILPSLHLPL